MGKISRRKLLNSGTAMVIASAMTRTAFGLVSPEHSSDPAKIRFLKPLRIPPVLRPTRWDETTDYYEIVQKEALVEILPGKETRIWGYQGMFPGPTIKAQRGRKVIVRHTNELAIHTVVHLHGGITAADSDGFPTDMIMSGTSKSYAYSNEGRGSTLWYHDHAMDHTGRNIYMGLAGLYLIEDQNEASSKLPNGEFDIPLILQSHLFAGDGSLEYHAGPGGRFGAEDNTILVNGVPWPQLKVAARKYRFRILNASNARTFRLALSSGRPLVQIATDGGLLSEPVKSSSIPLAMAERVEMVVDFSEYPLGTRIVLNNTEEDGPLGEIMQFEVVRSEGDDSRIPERLSEIAALDRGSSVRERSFDFGGTLSLSFPPVTWTINGKTFDPNTPLVRATYGDVEVWHFRNRKFGPLGMLHPVHIHLVNFQILERNGGAPMPWERGWKDTISLKPGEEAKVIMKFDGYRGRYLIHCHNLEHEDHSMMARFDVV